MTSFEWKEFWEKVDILSHEYDTEIYRVEDGGGWRVIANNPSKDSTEVPKTSAEIIQTGILVTEAYYGFRVNTGESPYLRMLKLEWRANAEGPVPFGMSRSRIVYVSQDPQAVFAILYA